MTTSATALLAKTQGQHGFWLTNHADIIEPQVSSLISIHGEATALALINTTDSNASKDLYKVIEHVRQAVEDAEHNPKTLAEFKAAYDSLTDHQKNLIYYA